MAPIRADIYCRLSLAVMGDTAKVDDQERICRELAARLGWDVGAVHKDNSVSAWKRDRKRPGWDAMLARIQDAQAGAIVVYHGDRLLRQPWDLELLLNLAASRGIRLASPTGTRDLGNPDDQFVLRIEAAMACRESDNISRRKKAGYEQMRVKGIVRAGGRGGRAFGFAADGITQMPAECDAIREAARRITGGEAVTAVARSFTAAGLLTTAGNPWTYATMRRMLERPRYVALMPDGTSPAAWQPVLDRAVRDMCCAVLRSRSAGYEPRASNQPRYLLSGIAECTSCGSRMWAHHNGAAQQLSYTCQHQGCPRKLARSMAALDAHVDGWMVAALNSDEFTAALTAGADPGITARIAGLEQRREEAARQLACLAAHPSLTPDMVMRAIGSFDAAIGVLRDQMRLPARRALLARHQGITRQDWQRLPLEQRRAAVAAAFRIEVLPAKRRPGFDPSAVRVTPWPVTEGED